MVVIKIPAYIKTLKDINKNIIYPQTKADAVFMTGYEKPSEGGEILPTDTIKQAFGKLDSAVSLSPDIASALGLTGNPQVKDALAAISGGFVDTRKYWWGKYNLAYIEALGTSTTITAGNASYQGNTIVNFYSTIIINPYTGAITAGTSNGVVIDSSPTSAFSGKYLPGGGGAWYKCSGITTVSNTGYYYTHTISAQPVSVAITGKGDYVEDVYAYTSDAYPKNGVQGNNFYIYIGKSPRIPAQIATGSYTGTGTYGVNNKNSITLPFRPCLVFIKSNYEGAGGTSFAMVNGNNSVAIWEAGSANVSGDRYAKLEWASNGVKWYSDANSSGQLNNSGMIFTYVAIG